MGPYIRKMDRALQAAGLSDCLSSSVTGQCNPSSSKASAAAAQCSICMFITHRTQKVPVNYLYFLRANKGEKGHFHFNTGNAFRRRRLARDVPCISYD